MRRVGRRGKQRGTPSTTKLSSLCSPVVVCRSSTRSTATSKKWLACVLRSEAVILVSDHASALPTCSQMLSMISKASASEALLSACCIAARKNAWLLACRKAWLIL